METIENGLTNSKVVMPCFSQNQLKSGWCRAEYNAVLGQVISRKTKQKVTPLIIDDMKDADIPLLVSNIKYERLSDQRGYTKLLRVLKAESAVLKR